ncbi:MAG: helicase-associated domain-containing protein, partial [Spirochaetia bacterium]|nr:helicase-associated domain-containing protein [Spirochaetia bacterium]
MAFSEDKPIIVQSDGTILLDVHSPNFESARDDISVFAELIKSPEHIHTYSISSISLWNAASAGIPTQEVIKRLKKWSRFDIPDNILFQIEDSGSLFGKLVLVETGNPETLMLKVENSTLYKSLLAVKKLEKLLMPAPDDNAFLVSVLDRGTVKQELINLGYPVKDNIPLRTGEPMEFKLRKT